MIIRQAKTRVKPLIYNHFFVDSAIYNHLFVDFAAKRKRPAGVSIHRQAASLKGEVPPMSNKRHSSDVMKSAIRQMI